MGEVFKPTWKCFERYCKHLVNEGATANSISMFQASARHYNTQLGQSHLNDCPTLARMWQGAAKVNAPVSRTLKPFTTKTLLSMIKETEKCNELKVWRTTASAVISFLALLHISEATSLKASDITITAKNIKVRIKSAKRRANGFTSVIARGSALANFVERYFEKFKILKSDGPCFPLQANKKEQAKASTIQIGLKAIVEKLGLSSKEYAFHSCKIGGATLAAEKRLAEKTY